MEIKVLQNAPQANTLGTGLEGSVPQETAGASAAPVLSGASVSVRGTTDFEKLLAELELQRDEQKEKIARGQFSAALAVLAGRQGGLSQTQQAAIASVASTSAALSRRRRLSARRRVTSMSRPRCCRPSRSGWRG